MASKSILLLTLLASSAFAQDDADISSALASLSALGESFPTAIPSVTGDLSSLASEASQVESLFADLPTLPAAVIADLSSAAPSSLTTETDYTSLYCDAIAATKTPDWYSSLPKSDISAISSYTSALSSWESKHSDALSSLTSDNSYAIPKCTGTGGGSSSSSSSSAGSGSGSSTSSSTQSGASSTNSSNGQSAAGMLTLDRAVAALMAVVGIVGVWAW